VTPQNLRDPTFRRRLKAFGNPDRTENTGKKDKSQPRSFRRVRKVRRADRRLSGDWKKRQNMRESRRKAKQEVAGVSYQNTVCLRVSQLEDVAASATRPNC
jgi:hypothetical protein